MSKTWLAIIPARGGSKGIPNKNLVILAGKPLMVWSIEAALQSKYISKTVVSSDSQTILNTAKEFGADSIKRPKALSQDDSRTEPVITDVLQQLEAQQEAFDYVVLLQPTSPLRKAKDIDTAIETLQASNANALISVVEQGKQPLKSFTKKENGFLEGLVNNEFPFMPRQALPQTYLPNGAIYIVEVDYFKETKKLFSNTTLPYVMPKEQSLDIDSAEDLVRATRFLKPTNT